MRRQELKSTRKTTPDADPEDKHNTNVALSTNLDPSTTRKRKIYSDLCGLLPITSNKGDNYIYVIYVYGCNTITTNTMNTIKDKEMICAFT